MRNITYPPNQFRPPEKASTERAALMDPEALIRKDKGNESGTPSFQEHTTYLPGSLSSYCIPRIFSGSLFGVPNPFPFKDRADGEVRAGLH